MTIAVGTSGFAFKEWKGVFYPKDLPDDQMLAYYAERLATVEINNTFYRMPKESVVTDWASKAPPGFKFSFKASQRITHMGRLKDVDDSLAYFLKVSTALGESRGPTLFQLPPNFKKDLPRLEAFLALLPKRWRAAFEFRHLTWFDDEVYAALREKDAALCIADHDDFETPLVRTASWGYLRLHRLTYDAAALAEWRKKIGAEAWSEAFVYFKHDYAESSGPPAAVAFKQL